jgi:hypothetical protein
MAESAVYFAPDGTIHANQSKKHAVPEVGCNTWLFSPGPTIVTPTAMFSGEITCLA